MTIYWNMFPGVVTELPDHDIKMCYIVLHDDPNIKMGFFSKQHNKFYLYKTPHLPERIHMWADANTNVVMADIKKGS